MWCVKAAIFIQSDVKNELNCASVVRSLNSVHTIINTWLLLFVSKSHNVELIFRK